MQMNDPRGRVDWQIAKEGWPVRRACRRSRWSGNFVDAKTSSSMCVASCESPERGENSRNIRHTQRNKCERVKLMIISITLKKKLEARERYALVVGPLRKKFLAAGYKNVLIIR